MTIGPVIEGVPIQELKDLGFEVKITVVDGHCQDNTKDIADNKGAQVIMQNGNSKGWGVRTAFEMFNGDYIFMMDADDTYFWLPNF